MKNRIIQLLTKENISATRFAELIGVQRSSISHILSGRNKPSYDFIEKIMLKYPLLNADWLILGKGDMYKHQNKDLNTEKSTNNSSNKDLENNLFTNRNSDTQKPVSVNNSQDLHPIQTKKMAENNMVTSVNNRKIEKILVFYSDNTFKEYLPE